MEIKQLVLPAALPVSLSEARLQCSLLDSRHDQLLLGLIRAASAYVEAHTRARLCEQTVQFVSPQFPENLPVYPVKSISEIAYTDENGDAQTVEAVDYYATTDSIYPRILPIAGTWPKAKALPNAVRITAVVGFDYVPEDVKAAILIRVKEMFDRRSESATGTITSPSFIRITDLLAPHRMIPL